MEEAKVTYRAYAGIGSRKTPASVSVFMTRIAIELAIRDFTLRSGGAQGADQAFGLGSTRKEVYLPWRGFEGSDSPYIVQPGPAGEIASQFHPVWDRLSQGAKKLHSRNAHQILGQNLDTPVKFVICWTPDGCFNQATRKSSTGGTGMAIAIADHYNIPVFNLMRAEHYDRLRAMVVGGE